MSKSLDRIQEKTNEHCKKVNKTFQDLEKKIKPIKKTEAQGILDMKNLATETETTEASSFFLKRI